MVICTVEGCVDKNNAKGMCNTHYNRMKRHGTLVKPERIGRPESSNPNWVGENAAYTTIHSRLRSVKGTASAHLCVECGRAARDWAYTNDCPREKDSRFGRYSLDLDRYQPMCRTCHRKFDIKASQVLA